MDNLSHVPLTLSLQYISLMAGDKGLNLHTPCDYFPVGYYNASLKVVNRPIVSLSLLYLQVEDIK